MDITLGNRSETTGRYNFVEGSDGDISFDDTEAHAVVTSTLEKKGSWWVDPNHGSDLRKLRNLTTSTPSQAEATILEALAPLEADKSITSVQVSASVERVNGQRTGRLNTSVRWSTPSGSQNEERVT